MKIQSDSVEKWLIPKNEQDGFEQYFKVLGEEEKESDKGKYSILKLATADGDFKVSSWALTTEKGTECNTEKGMRVKLWKKKGVAGKFYIKNIEEMI